jgi:hypothetical protein
MFDKKRQLFCHRLVATKQGMVQQGISPRYTVMTLLGLKELEAAGVATGFDVPAIYASFVRDTKWVRSSGDLGLVIWLVARFAPQQLESFLRTLDCRTAMERFADAREGRTMELAWFLCGLAHAAEASSKLKDDLKNLATETYRRLVGNQGEHGLFGHMNAKKSLAGRLRGRIGSFADQVYPIQAFSKAAQVFEMEGATARALECASAICAVQGESGQWWWLYDSRTGRVSSRYPVYSVHQHGMAPMCLLAVEEVSGQSFRKSLDKGLRWIYGANELGLDMRDATEKTIWRCISPRNGSRKLLEVLASAFRQQDQNSPAGRLEVLREQRPYEYGWLLFALARLLENKTLADGHRNLSGH